MTTRKPPQQPIGYSIKDFIERKKFNVPQFQRRYDWTETHIRDMWEDLTTHVLVLQGKNPNQTHYFGNSIVWKHEGVHELIDGQQRTLTFLALIAALRDLFKEKEMLEEEIQARNLLWDYRGKHSYIHTANSLDEPKLQDMINPNFECNPMALSLPRLHKAYTWFKEYLYEEYDKELKHNQGDIEKTKAAATNWYYDILDHSHISAVTCDTMDEAFTMFKAHNSRGLDLNASDMVKVALMSFMKKRGVTSDEFMTLWTKLDERCNEKPQEIGYMLGDFYKSRGGNMISSTGLLKHWSAMLEHNSLKAQKSGRIILKQLDDFSEVWSHYYYKIDGNDSHNDLVDMRVSNQLAPMIAAWKGSGAGILQKGFVADLVSCIEYVHMHAKLAGMVDSNSLKKAYVEWANWMWKTGNPADAINLIKKSARTFKVGTKETFKTNLRHRTDLTAVQTRFILKKAEGLKNPGLSANKMNHVEHIVPKAYKSNPEWDHIKWDDHTTKLNNLGNLTLLLDTTNMSIGNKGWSSKALALRSSDLGINKDITAKAHTQWTDSVINSRCNEIASYLYDNWKIRGD
jgi:hypothetical protein